MGAGGFSPFGFEVGIELIGVLGVCGVGLLEAWLTHPAPPVHRARIHGSDAARCRCPYCHEQLGEGDAQAATLSCGTCKTVHHALCWTGHGGCSVFGCGAVQSRQRQEEAEPAPPAARVVERTAG